MRFWDSSALLPLIVEEACSRSCRDLYRADPDLAVWTFAPLEVWGGCCRKRRERVLDDQALERARARLARAVRRWTPLDDSPGLRATAEQLLRRHDLRTADAIQLAAAITWCRGRTRGRMLVAGDDRLLAAARAVGFDAIQPAGA